MHKRAKKPRSKTYIVKYVAGVNKEGAHQFKTVETNELYMVPISEVERELVFKDGVYYVHCNLANILWFKNKKSSLHIITTGFEQTNPGMYG